MQCQVYANGIASIKLILGALLLFAEISKIYSKFPSTETTVTIVTSSFSKLATATKLLHFCSVTISLFTWSKESGFFGGPAFIQPIRAIWKFSKSPDWLEKAGPPKKPLLLLSCKETTCNWNYNYFKK